MHVDKDLLARVIEEIVDQLSQERSAERILVIGSREDGAKLELSTTGTTNRRFFFSEEGYDGAGIDRYILPLLQLNDMADLASGKAATPSAELIRSLLLAGKTVEVLDYAYKSHKNTAPPQLYRLFRQYDETLRTFGLFPMEAVHKPVSLSKRVISEKDLEECRASGIGRISISPNALVTSLAHDYARRYGIEIQRSERGA